MTTQEVYEEWRTLLLRSLVKGEHELMVNVLTQHPEAISPIFTTSLRRWQLQWETTQWWMIENATPLFVASVFAHVNLIKWLIVYGANRSIKCYKDHLAVDFIGDCCTNPDVEQVEECRRLLLEPPLLPSPPTQDVEFNCHISRQIEISKSTTQPANVTSSNRSHINQGVNNILKRTEIQSCVVVLTWTTPPSNGAMIDKYEVRYRIVVADIERKVDEGSGYNWEDSIGEDISHGNVLQDRYNNNSNSNLKVLTQSTAGALRHDETQETSWQIEYFHHNRRLRKQGKVIDGLQFNTMYEFSMRSWSSAGKGKWSKLFKFKTIAS